ncbi:lipase 3-like [Cimex lectularius]|uniref:Lipase n=1 Tax=Cimex lectularius TaxID=79782 RepID=A0A8I6SBN6_CIMLE|nr:lipase 3-like [Cimex lectularius]
MFTFYIVVLFALFAPYSFKSVSTNEVIPSDDWRKPPDSAEMIAQRGYPVEVHHVETEDGYILKAFRIPFGKKSVGGKRPPVILQHGILCSSDCWTIMSPEKGLAYRLVDSGYDVWVTNNRGAPYGKNHTKLTPDDQEFWDYSVHELGYYDVPALIDYILKQTGYSKLTYIGHSQGTSQFFIMGSTRPEYNDKVNVMAALGPVAYLDHTHGLIKLLSSMSSFLAKLAKLFNMHEVLEHPLVFQLANKVLCGPYSVLRPLCNDVFFYITGFDSPQMNNTIGSEIGNYCPTGATIKQLNHFAQLTHNGKFTMFDYGTEENMVKYNSLYPPQYDLTKVKCPVVLYHGQNDYISSPPEVVRLSKVLPNLVKRDLVDYPKFNHLDFMWAIDINKLLNNDVLKTIKKFHG